METMRPRLALVAIAAVVIAACSGVRHPLDDSETKPDTETQALDEAGTTMDGLGDSVFGNATFAAQTWAAPGACATADFAPSQGDVGQVLIRTYAEDDVSTLGTPDQLLDAYEAYWTALDESVSRSSPNMDPGVVSRVNGIGYELVSIPPSLELRAFIPCY